MTSKYRCARARVYWELPRSVCWELSVSVVQQRSLEKRNSCFHSVRRLFDEFFSCSKKSWQSIIMWERETSTLLHSFEFMRTVSQFNLTYAFFMCNSLLIGRAINFWFVCFTKIRVWKNFATKKGKAQAELKLKMTDLQIRFFSMYVAAGAVEATQIWVCKL